MSSVSQRHVRAALAARWNGILYAWRYTVVRVIDGDTVACAYDLGGGYAILPVPEVYTTHVRFLGVDAPEIETDAGVEAAEWLSALLPPGSTGGVSWHALDGRGRLLGSLTTDSGIEVTELGRQVGWLRSYNGRGPKPW